MPGKQWDVTLLDKRVTFSISVIPRLTNFNDVVLEVRHVASVLEQGVGIDTVLPVVLELAYIILASGFQVVGAERPLSVALSPKTLPYSSFTLLTLTFFEFLC